MRANMDLYRPFPQGQKHEEAIQNDQNDPGPKRHDQKLHDRYRIAFIRDI